MTRIDLRNGLSVRRIAGVPAVAHLKRAELQDLVACLRLPPRARATHADRDQGLRPCRFRSQPARSRARVVHARLDVADRVVARPAAVLVLRVLQPRPSQGLNEALGAAGLLEQPFTAASVRAGLPALALLEQARGRSHVLERVPRVDELGRRHAEGRLVQEALEEPPQLGRAMASRTTFRSGRLSRSARTSSRRRSMSRWTSRCVMASMLSGTGGMRP